MRNQLIVALALGGLLAANVQASSTYDKGHPQVESDVLRLYPDAIKLQDGVYDVKRGESGRIFLFGTGGMKYRISELEKFRRMAANSPSVTKQDIASMDRTLVLSKAALRNREQREAQRSLTKGVEFYNEPMCGQYVDVIVGYYDGWTAAQAHAYIEAEFVGGISWEGDFFIAASAYKYNGSTIYDSDLPNPVQVYGGDSLEAGVADTWGAPQECVLWASAAVIANGEGEDCNPDPWIDYGPCV